MYFGTPFKVDKSLNGCRWIDLIEKPCQHCRWWCCCNRIIFAVAAVRCFHAALGLQQRTHLQCRVSWAVTAQSGNTGQPRGRYASKIIIITGAIFMWCNARNHQAGPNHSFSWPLTNPADELCKVSISWELNNGRVNEIKEQRMVLENICL